MSRHTLTAALASRLLAVDARRHACLAADLSALGGDLVTEAPAISVLDRLVSEIVRLEGVVAGLRAELARRDVASGVEDLRERVGELEGRLDEKGAS